MNSNTIFKLKQLQVLSFEERKLFLAINQICITLLSFCDNLYNYMSIKEYRNTKLGQILYNNRKMFYDIINKIRHYVNAFYGEFRQFQQFYTALSRKERSYEQKLGL